MVKWPLIGVSKLRSDKDGDALHGEFSPVEAHAPIEVRLLTGVGEDEVHTRLSTDTQLSSVSELPEHDDKTLSAWLKMINAKLEAIIGLLDRESSEFRSLNYRKMEISGGGIRLELNGEFPVGGIVEVRMMMPIIPPVALYVYGRVTECREGAVSIKYLPMDEEIRDRIVHFVFLRQREIFREKREKRRMEN